MDKHGQIFLIPDAEVNMWRTSLCLPDEINIEAYHQLGESEQYHSELKSDTDVERLPSGKFETNALILELTVIAYNIFEDDRSGVYE